MHAVRAKLMYYCCIPGSFLCVTAKNDRRKFSARYRLLAAATFDENHIASRRGEEC